MSSKTASKRVKTASATPATDDFVTIWREIGGRLVPIIGQRGFAALHNRSLYTSRADHPFLTTVHQSGLSAVDYVALQTVLKQQSDEQAQAATKAQLQIFYERLSYLIGESFTERLLRPILDTYSSDIAPQKAPDDPP